MYIHILQERTGAIVMKMSPSHMGSCALQPETLRLHPVWVRLEGVSAYAHPVSP